MRPCRRENGLLSTNPSGRHAGKISLVEVALRFSGVTSSTPRPRHPTHPASTLCVHCVFNVGTLRVSCACYAWAMKGPMRVQCVSVSILLHTGVKCCIGLYVARR